MRRFGCICLLLAAVAASAQEVNLPLARYDELRARAHPEPEPEPEPPVPIAFEQAVVEIAAQSTTVGITGTSARMTTTFRVELRGTPTAPVALPFAGLAERSAVEPRRDATLHRHNGAVVLVAPQPGSYTVTVESVAALSEADGVSRLELPATASPVATVEVELAAELESSAEAAVVISDDVTGSRRRLRLAPEQGKVPVLELRHRVAGAEEGRLLARAAVVTVEADKLRREWEDREQQEDFDEALETLDLGLETGVKPLAVDIPKSGKVLILRGVLTPAEVTVELEVRAR